MDITSSMSGYRSLTDWHPLDRFHFDPLKGGEKMATLQEMLNAANKTPSQRTAYEQSLVDRGSADQRVRNADHEAKRNERIFGK